MPHTLTSTPSGRVGPQDHAPRRPAHHAPGPLCSPDDIRVIVRPIRDEDAEGLARAYTQLSEQSRWRRFLSVAEQIPPGLLRYLTSVDHQSHVAVVAIDPDTEEILGSARYIRIPGRRPVTAELAVEVIDRWQRRGLGRVLLHALGRLAQANGVERLLAIVSNDNVPMQLLMRRTGATLETTGSELEYTIDPEALAQLLPAIGSHRQPAALQLAPWRFGKPSIATAPA